MANSELSKTHGGQHDESLRAPHHPADPLEIDYSKFDPRFDNRPVKIGPEWSALDEARSNYIKDHALSWKSPETIPKTFPGLESITRRKTPSTRLWYRRVSSWERNGFFNIWTIKLNVKLKYWCLYPCLIWGMTSHVNIGWYQENYNHEGDRDWRVYDKLSNRVLPFHRVWNRPG